MVRVVLVLLIALIAARASAEVPSEREVSETRTFLTGQADRVSARIAALTDDLRRKSSLLDALRARLARAQQVTEPRARARQVSRFALAAFVVEARVRAIELKLDNWRALVALGARLDGPDGPRLVREQLVRAAAAQRTAFEQLIAQGVALAPTVEDPAYRKQLDAFVGQLRADTGGGPP